MKRVVVEVPYHRFWARFFGPHASRTRVVAGLKCFKCDEEGFALICRIQFLDKGMTPDMLLHGTPIQTVETLYRMNDGSYAIFISGRYPRSTRRSSWEGKVFVAEPPEFIDANLMKFVLVGEEKALRDYSRETENRRSDYNILSVTPVKAKQESVLSRLTGNQRKALVAAYGLGYYEAPKRITSGEMAKLLKIDKSTLSEHLRKAERRIITNILTE